MLSVSREKAKEQTKNAAFAAAIMTDILAKIIRNHWNIFLSNLLRLRQRKPSLLRSNFVVHVFERLPLAVSREKAKERTKNAAFAAATMTDILAKIIQTQWNI